jgi:hypothetical protein
MSKRTEKNLKADDSEEDEFEVEKIIDKKT